MSLLRHRLLGYNGRSCVRLFGAAGLVFFSRRYGGKTFLLLFSRAGVAGELRTVGSLDSRHELRRFGSSTVVPPSSG